MRRVLILIAALAVIGCASPSRETGETAHDTSSQLKLPDELVDLVRQGHCEYAVSRLNRDLKEPTVGTLLLAGLMYEAGACVERSWARAEPYFLRAAEKGNHNAMLQLVAGYASSLGRDPAASLWWAQRTNVGPRPKDCRIEGYRPDMTPEAFVEQLNRWGLARVRACTYVVGVWAKLLADRYYPWGALRGDETGTVTLTFMPADGTFQASLTRYGKAVDDRQWRVDDEVDRKGDLMSYVRNASLKAAQRFARPPEIPAEWRTTMQLAFVQH